MTYGIDKEDKKNYLLLELLRSDSLDQAERNLILENALNPQGENKAMSLLSKIQKRIIVGKTVDNNFGGFKYKTLDLIIKEYKKIIKDIEVETEKPIKCSLVFNSNYIVKDGHKFMRTFATLHNEGCFVRSFCDVSQEEAKKGMDKSQISGSAITYSKKYALECLFAIQETPDVDSEDNANLVKKKKKNLKPFNLEEKKNEDRFNNLIEQKNFNFFIIKQEIENHYKIEDLDLDELKHYIEEKKQKEGV